MAAMVSCANDRHKTSGTRLYFLTYSNETCYFTDMRRYIDAGLATALNFSTKNETAVYDVREQFGVG